MFIVETCSLLLSTIIINVFDVLIILFLQYHSSLIFFLFCSDKKYRLEYEPNSQLLPPQICSQKSEFMLYSNNFKLTVKVTVPLQSVKNICNMESDLLYLHPLQVTYEAVPFKLHSITFI